jgi:hypothetical protein
MQNEIHFSTNRKYGYEPTSRHHAPSERSTGGMLGGQRPVLAQPRARRGDGAV